MKFLGLLLVLMLSGCSGSGGRQQSLAQCQLDALSSKGSTFRRNYAEGEFEPSGKDGSYREFILTCMEAEGYEFATPFEKTGEMDKSCWIEDPQGSFPDAYVDGASCYSRKWW